jgi:hypothetical protein
MFEDFWNQRWMVSKQWSWTVSHGFCCLEAGAIYINSAVHPGRSDIKNRRHVIKGYSDYLKTLLHES